MFSGMNQTTSPALAPHHMALIPPERLAEIQKEYFEELAHLATNPNAIEINCLLYTSPSPRDGLLSRMPSSA